MTTTAPTGRPTRGAFTLIELLVVIAIMAVLAAVAVGTYFRIQGGQMVKGTEDRIKNLNAGLARQWSATLDTGKKEFTQNTGNCKTILTTYCGGDQERALSLWLYLKIKNEFPQTFGEAKTDLILRDSGGTEKLRLKAKKTFDKLTNTSPTDATQAAHQSAALLHIILMDRAARGETYAEEAIGAGAGTVEIANTKYSVFNDLWGNPLAYVRFATNSEINDRPFTKPGTTSKDPLDPGGTLLATKWTDAATSANRLVAARAVFGPGSNGFPDANWMLTVVSSGPDQADADGKYHYDSIESALGQVTQNSFITVDPTKDDVLGYRLRQEGQGGN